MTRAYLTDMRALGYCMGGCRRFFRRHGIDWGRVRREGVSVAALRATGDAMAERLAEHAEARRGQR